MSQPSEHDNATQPIAGQTTPMGDPAQWNAALAAAASLCDSAAHHWSGAAAQAFFECAARIRALAVAAPRAAQATETAESGAQEVQIAEVTMPELSEPLWHDNGTPNHAALAREREGQAMNKAERERYTAWAEVFYRNADRFTNRDHVIGWNAWITRAQQASPQGWWDGMAAAVHDLRCGAKQFGQTREQRAQEVMEDAAKRIDSIRWSAVQAHMRTRPVPAPDLTGAAQAMARAKALPVWDNIPHALHVELDTIFRAVARAQQAPAEQAA